MSRTDSSDERSLHPHYILTEPSPPEGKGREGSRKRKGVLVETPKTKCSLFGACGDWPWTMNGNEAQRLAHAINAHRPDWMISSLSTFIARNMASWSYRDAAVALTFVACDAKPDGQPASETPKRVLEQGPWRVAAAAGGSTSMRTHAPKRHEECPIHAGQWAHNCGGCRTDALVADDEPLPRQPSHADASLARALLAQTLAGCCACGVKRALCPTHRETTTEPEETQ